VFLSGFILLLEFAQPTNYGEGKGKAMLEAGRPAHGCRAKSATCRSPEFMDDCSFMVRLLSVRAARRREQRQNGARERLTLQVSFAVDSVISVSVRSTPSTALIVSVINFSRSRVVPKEIIPGAGNVVAFQYVR
jgi:hypothetical protein